MILHAAEIWAAIAACFVLGALVGSLLHRTLALTGARRAQTAVIQSIDRTIRAFERVLMPWRGTVPDILPQTVPVPPPDFRHVVDVPEVHPPAEPDRHWDSLTAAAAPESAADAASAPPAHPAYAALLHPGDAMEPVVGFQPLPLPAPRGGVADPLHLIHGLTKRHGGRLAKIGIFHFSQIASWTPQEVLWVADYLGAGDSVASKDWVGQAMHFASSDEPIREPEPKPRAKRVAAAKSDAGKGAARRTPGKAGAAKKAKAKSKTEAETGAAKPARRKRAASKKEAASKAEMAADSADAATSVQAGGGGEVAMTTAGADEPDKA
jgi:predicted flap endonuclease-1-like 5' DNA nuclease